jgi:AcrR family transcriptional regulator
MRAEARAQRFDNKRQEVLRAAGRVFARLGFHNASLNDIGAELGTTAAALYYYAKSKDQLLADCRQVALETIEAALEEGKATGADGYARLRIFFYRYAALICGDFGRCLVLVNLNDIPTRLRNISRARQRAILNEVQLLIREGMKDGSIRACDDLLMANLLFGAFNHLTKWWTPSGPNSIEAVASSYLDALASGIAPASASTSKPPRTPAPAARKI